MLMTKIILNSPLKRISKPDKNEKRTINGKKFFFVSLKKK